MTSTKIRKQEFDIAKGIGIWTNDSFAQISIKGVTKQFNVTIQADGTLVGSVEDIT